jgi:hypothetical protein
MLSSGWAVLASTETVANNVTVVTPSDKTGRDILIAATVTVVGSIIVAFIAAATAGKRQKRSLTAADDEHKDTLTSQSEQHEETLKFQAKQHTESLAAVDRHLTQRLQHERKQQDVLHLRGFFDEIALEYEGAREALSLFSGLRKPPVSSPELLAKARGDSYQAKLKTGVALDRVALWFGDDHEVYRTYSAIKDTVSSSYTFLTAGEGEFVAEQEQESTRLGGRLLGAFRSFTAAARAEITGAIEAAEAE